MLQSRDEALFKLVQSRWNLPIIAALMEGPRRFTDLKGALEGISATALAHKLKTLEEQGLLFRRTHSQAMPVQVYELTDWGYAGRAVLVELRKWARFGPAHGRPH